MDVTAGSVRFQDRKLGELCFFDVDQNIDDSQKTINFFQRGPYIMTIVLFSKYFLNSFLEEHNLGLTKQYYKIWV